MPAVGLESRWQATGGGEAAADSLSGTVMIDGSSTVLPISQACAEEFQKVYKNVKVVATATAGTTIHTAHATATDEVWLYACNTDSTDRKLTIEYGGTTSPDDLTEVTIAAESGWTLVIPGLLLTNSLVIKAFAASANVIEVNGYVNRIT